MINKHFAFEKNIIDVILNLIKDNQEYLTQPENLPQLAKLGFMYNALWYAKQTLTLEQKKEYGIGEDEEADYDDCEDNPKYKIEMCEPIDDEIDELIYDAWGMHVDNNPDPITWDKFINLIKNGRELNDFDLKMLKVNKTFDEWVDVLTDTRYSYKYENRKDVANDLMCVIGVGYKLNKNGFIIQTDNGDNFYGDWENAKFSEYIKKLFMNCWKFQK